MPTPDPLDNPEYRAFAWARFRRLLGWMALVALAAAGAADTVLWWWVGPFSIHILIATALGVFFTVLLAAALMGLMFLSSGTGHDEAVERADLGEDAAAWRNDSPPR
ncbi:hypothetical protein SAMN06297144_3506 [Sphingomonas guangdongensis]|uniref:Uncharacterized protein n=1 Tax=Sphingomonas guangdongensis TaxID=1141890 RepID=A0A285R2M4_9SPHN|nr:hypothetical protein [Sphingomonas guangdongensis]SOB88353.1 hypothetical protein SAMN06297144_3506 [Sphingomonas guangdongensis]